MFVVAGKSGFIGIGKPTNNVWNARRFQTVFEATDVAQNVVGLDRYVILVFPNPDRYEYMKTLRSEANRVNFALATVDVMHEGDLSIPDLEAEMLCAAHDYLRGEDDD